MKRDNKKCDFAMLSRFYDQEVGSHEEGEIIRHLEHCRSCRKALQDNETVSAFLKAGIRAELSRSGVEKVEEDVMAVIHGEELSWWKRYKGLSLSKAFYVPAAAAAVFLLIFLSVFRSPSPIPGPSAIVESVKGEVSSVMIFETEKSRQTVVWFNEVPFSGSGDGEQESGAEYKPVPSIVSIA
jgi:hypothetical protein